MRLRPTWLACFADLRPVDSGLGQLVLLSEVARSATSCEAVQMSDSKLEI